MCEAGGQAGRWAGRSANWLAWAGPAGRPAGEPACRPARRAGRWAAGRAGGPAGQPAGQPPVGWPARQPAGRLTASPRPTCRQARGRPADGWPAGPPASWAPGRRGEGGRGGWCAGDSCAPIWPPLHPHPDSRRAAQATCVLVPPAPLRPLAGPACRCCRRRPHRIPPRTPPAPWPWSELRSARRCRRRHPTPLFFDN